MPADIDIQLAQDRLAHLDEALAEHAVDPTNTFLRDSVVLRFTFAFDGVASTLRRYLLNVAPTHGSERTSPHRCLREAVDRGLVAEGSAWMLHADHRNHFDRESNADAIAANAATFAADARALLNAMAQGIADGG
ncbi:MAG: hypothetical protein F4X64_19110 [Chloroflexi bacterium]|nr:hypothetical protein [Chloroflexota bacterium]